MELPKLPALPGLHELQKFQLETIDRRSIKGADYNPRYITEQAKKKLRAALKKVGLIAPVTWNAKTGTLVGGHQRLAALDALHGSPEYSLTVARVDMTSGQEKAANLLLNNPEAQGEWDMSKLGLMLSDKELDLEAAGMGSSDVFKIIGQDAPEAVLEEIADRVEKAREIADATAKKRDEHSTDYYWVVVFRDPAERASAATKLGLDDNRYVSGEDIMRALESKPTEAAKDKAGV